MNEERDPRLEALFGEAEQELSDDRFTMQVMMSVERRRRRVLAGRLGIAAMLVAFELMLSAPLQSSVGILTDALAAPLIDVGSDWLALIAAPLNSVAGLVGMLFLGVHAFYRKTVR